MVYQEHYDGEPADPHSTYRIESENDSGQRANDQKEIVQALTELRQHRSVTYWIQGLCWGFTIGLCASIILDHFCISYIRDINQLAHKTLQDRHGEDIEPEPKVPCPAVFAFLIFFG